MPLPISALVYIKLTHASAIPNVTSSFNSRASPTPHCVLLSEQTEEYMKRGIQAGRLASAF